MLLHVVAKARAGARPLQAPAVAWMLWRSLRRAFPKTLAACLMPDHLHLLTEGATQTVATRLGRVLSGVSRSRPANGANGTWEPVPEPVVIPDHKHLVRQVRYVHLNPCRDGLVPDPLCWPWSTHRGVIGAECDPWLDAATLARSVRMPRAGFARWFHGYVSGDPSVAVTGTPLPRPAPARPLPVVPLGDVLDAVRAAAPLAPRATWRTGVVLLGREQGWTNSAIVARAIGVTPRWVRCLRELHHDDLLRAARLCLGDARLTWGTHPIKTSVKRIF